MSRVPASWIIVTLGEVISKPQYGWTASAVKTGKCRLLRTTDLSNGNVNWQSVPYCSNTPPELNKYQIFEDDILVSRAGSVGLSYRIKSSDKIENTVFASYLIRFRPLINISFVEHFLHSQQFWNQILINKAGIAVPNVNATKLSKMVFTLPPLNEQKRIADKLDRIMFKIDAVKERLERTPQIIKRFRQSVLMAAVTGKLTELFIQTGDVAQSNGYITSHKQMYSEEGLKQSRLWPESTICITIAANIAASAILTYPACFPDSVVGIINNPKLCERNFIIYYLKTIKENLSMYAPATAQKNINLSILNKVLFPLPTLKEQREIVRQVEKLFVLADELEAHYRKAKVKIDRLSQSVLAKAFRGELVPQDPDDEPAEKLLERIKEEKIRLETELKKNRNKNNARTK